MEFDSSLHVSLQTLLSILNSLNWTGQKKIEEKRWVVRQGVTIKGSHARMRNQAWKQNQSATWATRKATPGPAKRCH